MRRRLARLAVPLAAALVLASVPQSASATAGGAQELSDEGCEAFGDYFQVNFAIAFLTGFAEAFEDLETSGGDPGADGGDGPGGGAEAPGDQGTGDQPDIDELQNVVFLILSPKLEQATSVLVDEAPKSVRKIFRAQRDAYRDGVEILRDDLGLTKAQIEEIRDADFDEDTPDSLSDELDISRADLTAAAEEFGKSAGVLRAEDATAAHSRVFERLAIGCGTVPDGSLDCDDLVSADLQTQLLGSVATVESDSGCTYSVESSIGGPDPEIGVDVYRSAEAFGRLTEQSSPASEIDPDNVVVDGYTTFSSFKTCGRTLFALQGDTTIVVAICLPDDADVPDDMLTDVRDGVTAVVG